MEVLEILIPVPACPHLQPSQFNLCVQRLWSALSSMERLKLYQDSKRPIPFLKSPAARKMETMLPYLFAVDRRSHFGFNLVNVARIASKRISYRLWFLVRRHLLKAFSCEGVEWRTKVTLSNA
jgi:hypothetical protein